MRVRNSTREAILDGGAGKDGELWSASYCEELLEEGLPHVKKALQESFTFHSFIQEWIDTPLDGSLHCNTATDYLGGNKNHEDVKRMLECKRVEGMVCNRCILSGQMDTCKISKFGECCSNCVNDPECNAGDPCIYQFTVHAFADQGSEQRKALGEMHVANEGLGLDDVNYCKPGFGCLHQNKNITASFRNYRITDGKTGSLCITDLIAVACSDTGNSCKPSLCCPTLHLLLMQT